MAKLLEITGKAISGEWGQDDDTGTGIPVLRTTNFTNEGFVNYKNVVTRSISKKNIAEKYLRHGDVIIEKSGGSDKQPVGRVIFFEGEENKYLFNNFTGLLRVQNPEEWLPKYVFYALYAYYRNGGTRAFENRTTGLHNLQVDNYVKSVDIPKLSYRKQQHICETLDHVRDAVAYREQQLTKLDELIKARFVEMFGNFVYELDRWSTCEIGDVADTIDPQPSHRTPPVSLDGIPYIGIAECNYQTRKIAFKSARKVGKDVLKEHKNRYTLNDGDFIIGKIGTIGKPFFLPTDCDYTLSANTVLIKPQKDKISPRFLFAIFESEYMDRIIDAEKKSTSQPAFGIQKVRSIEIPLPPLSLQNQFAAFVAEVDKSKLLAELFAQSTCILAENRSK